MSAKHSTYRRLILFDVRPRVLPAQRWIRMFLGVIVIVKFMLLWKATIHAFEAAKSFLLRNVFIIFRRRICSLGSARVLSVLLQPRGFTGRFGNLWSIAMNFLLLKVLHRWCRASLYSSQGYGCHRHHDVRYMPTSLFFKVDNNTPCKIFRWYTWFESWSTGGGWEQFQNTHLRDCILPRCMFCRGVRNVLLTEHLSTVQFTTTLHLSLMTHFNLQHLHLHISWISDSDGMFGTFHLVGWIANCHIT